MFRDEYGKVSPWWYVLCSIVPIVGIVFYVILKLKNNPSKEAGIYLKSALIRIISVAFILIGLLNYLSQVVPGYENWKFLSNIYAITDWELLFFSLVLL